MYAGNTVVCKPSEITSVTAWMLCKIMKEAGLPNGVCNIIMGTGSKAGEALINHRDVNVINHTSLNSFKKIYVVACNLTNFCRLYHSLDPQM